MTLFQPVKGLTLVREKSLGMLVTAVVVLIIGLFLLELQVPVGVEVWLPNVAVVLLSLWLPHRWPTYLTAFACSVSTLLSLFFSPFIVPTWLAVVNRLLGIALFWITATMGLAARRTAELQKMNMLLRLEIAERHRGEAKLAEQASLLDLTQDAIIVRDMEGRIVFWNHGAERLYGWSAQQARGKNAIALLVQADSPGIAQAQDELLRKERWSGELHQVTREGRNIVVDSKWTLVRGAGGIPQSVLVVNTDVTAKKKLETQLLRTQRLESVGVLAGGVAHDFNNLLTPILMAVKLLHEKRSEADRLSLLATLQASAERGAEMVRQLLSFAGGSEAATVPIHLRHVIKEVKSILDHTFPKGIHIAARVPDNLLPVLADTTQVSQVLMNLCVNARDAMPDGGVLTITAENVMLSDDYARHHADAHPGRYVRMSVIDTGAGIAADVLDRIFDPFFSTKECGKGTGLGLSTVLGIVKSHSGFVNVYSEVGRGARFSVYFPAALKEETRAAELSPANFPVGRGEMILLVDDEASILKTVKTTLESYNYRVLTAPDGTEAVARYSQHQSEIQVVLLDMMMPGMDGPTTLAALRQLAPDVLVIATSGLWPKGRLAAEVGAGEMAFLQKPYTDEQLLTLLARVIKRT